MRKVDARMVKGLPEPQSLEAMDWVRETLAALQAREPGPDVDIAALGAALAAIEQRLAALEARPLPAAPPPPVDLSDLWDAIGALARRLEALEARPAVEVPAAQVITRDPLDPGSWDSLDAAKAALEVLVTREAARRCGHGVELYEQMVRLDALGDALSDDEFLLLKQHHGWARERQTVELARLEHNSRIRALDTLEAALAYDWRASWPALGT